MNSKDRIGDALIGIADRATRDRGDLWPRIAAVVAENGHAPIRRRRWVPSTVALVVLAGILLGCTAYTAYRKMIDAGLQAAADQGLVEAYQQPAAPTTFAVLSAPGGAGSRPLTGPNGASVELAWAYADESRIALELLIRGLRLPEGVATEDAVCRPLVTSGRDIRIGSQGAMVQMQDASSTGSDVIKAVYVFYQSIDAGKVNNLELSLDLTIGPCGPSLNEEGPALSKATPLPLIGNYHLAFELPVHQGLVISPNQTVKANGLSMRIDSLILEPSFTYARLCYEVPATQLEGFSHEWMPEMTLSIGDNEPAEAAVVPTSSAGAGSDEACGDFGFPVAYEGGPGTVTLTVSRLSTGMPSVVTNELASSAAASLARFGIDVRFLDVGSGVRWEIAKKPNGVTDAEAYDMVVSALRKHVEGPWVFVIRVG